MRRAIKFTVIGLLAAFIISHFFKHEDLMQIHYDTLEERNLHRTSLFGIKIKESVTWSKVAYRSPYRKIFEADPPKDRWRSWPTRTIWFATDRWRSPVTPRSLSLRNSVVEEIYKKHEQDHSVQAAKVSFRALESILPGSKTIEELGYEELESKRELLAESPAFHHLDMNFRSHGSNPKELDIRSESSPTK